MGGRLESTVVDDSKKKASEIAYSPYMAREKQKETAELESPERLQKFQEQLESLDLYEEEQYDRLSLEREKVDFLIQAQLDRARMGQEPYTEEELEGMFEVYVKDRDVLKLNIVAAPSGGQSIRQITLSTCMSVRIESKEAWLFRKMRSDSLSIGQN